jgi:PAS domain-containing protein
MTTFSALVDLASSAAFAVNGNSRIVACNGRLSSLMGYAVDEAVGCACYEVLRATLPNGQPLCSPACEGRACFAHHAPFAVPECSLRRRDGGRLKVAISTLVAPVSAGGSEPDAVAIVFLHRHGEETRCVRGGQAARSHPLVAAAGYALNRDAIWLDCEAFEGLIEEGQRHQQQGRAKDALACFEEAERLYMGDYLSDDLYADWCAVEAHGRPGPTWGCRTEVPVPLRAAAACSG